MRKVIWAPWRMEFIDKAHRSSKRCLLCDLLKKGVSFKSLILYKGKRVYVVLNRYPYTNGHLMVVPRCHVAQIEKLTSEDHAEIGGLIARSTSFLKKEFKAQGFNVGLNLGKAAGAGIKDHLHYHVVPRWVGDNNFMPIFSDVRTMPEHLRETYNKLVKHFQ